MSDIVIETDKITKTYVSGTNEVKALRACLLYTSPSPRD